MEHGKIRIQLATDAGWTDERGNTLLHYAVVTGDIDLVKLCLDEGVSATACNKNDESAQDTALAFGYSEMAGMIAAYAKQQRAASAEGLSYASLKDIRAAGGGVLFSLASRGMFDKVVALALKTSEELTENDLLRKNSDGDTVILRICQQGQLADLMKPELWCRNLPGFLNVWQNVPKVYQESVDIGSFISATRQAYLRSMKPITLKKKPPSTGV